MDEQTMPVESFRDEVERRLSAIEEKLASISSEKVPDPPKGDTQ